MSIKPIRNLAFNKHIYVFCLRNINKWPVHAQNWHSQASITTLKTMHLIKTTKFNLLFILVNQNLPPQHSVKPFLQ